MNDWRVDKKTKTFTYTGDKYFATVTDIVDDLEASTNTKGKVRRDEKGIKLENFANFGSWGLSDNTISRIASGTLVMRSGNQMYSGTVTFGIFETDYKKRL